MRLAAAPGSLWTRHSTCMELHENPATEQNLVLNAGLAKGTQQPTPKVFGMLGCAYCTAGLTHAASVTPFFQASCAQFGN
jgi:hypothetical protein